MKNKVKWLIVVGVAIIGTPVSGLLAWLVIEIYNKATETKS